MKSLRKYRTDIAIIQYDINATIFRLLLLVLFKDYFIKRIYYYVCNASIVLWLITWKRPLSTIQRNDPWLTPKIIRTHFDARHMPLQQRSRLCSATRWKTRIVYLGNRNMAKVVCDAASLPWALDRRTRTTHSRLSNAPVVVRKPDGISRTVVYIYMNEHGDLKVASLVGVNSNVDTQWLHWSSN